MRQGTDRIDQLLSNWWLLLVRGVIAVLFGILAFIWPGLTLLALVLLFGIYTLADGLLALWLTFVAAREQRRWWPFLVEGIAGVAAGILTFIWPGITALVLLYIIAAWAIVTGILEIIAAIRLREVIEGEWLLGLGGVLSILLGVLLAAQPAAGALALVWLIAAYAVVFGVVLIALALRVRGWRDRYRAAHAAP
ncbi:MAG: HdeD family acid-resistance protein [Chloroflexi bacterium]|nr:HdeD family acid-resistance protein [Chloroflexota bacterium]